MSSSPIAVFDSGLGGLSVLRELVRLMPNENYIYFGDSKNAPYGSRTHDDIMAITLDNIKKLADMGAKAIVVACNTATSIAINELRRIYRDIPVVGVEPALKPAVLKKPGSTVVVMATPMTLQEHKFAALMAEYSRDAKIIPLPAPRLARMIEDGILDGTELEGYLVEVFSPYKNERIDSVVLGCTHYPFVKETIRKIFDHNIEIFDGAEGTAMHTRHLLEMGGMLNKNETKGTLKLMTSGDEEKFIRLAEVLLKK